MLDNLLFVDFIGLKSCSFFLFFLVFDYVCKDVICIVIGYFHLVRIA